jgi:hypothetical protein
MTPHPRQRAEPSASADKGQLENENLTRTRIEGFFHSGRSSLFWGLAEIIYIRYFEFVLILPLATRPPNPI